MFTGDTIVHNQITMLSAGTLATEHQITGFTIKKLL